MQSSRARIHFHRRDYRCIECRNAEQDAVGKCTSTSRKINEFRHGNKTEMPTTIAEQ